MLWGMGVVIVAPALLGFGVERARWGGRDRSVHMPEVLFLCAVPVGTIVAIVGLILEVGGK